MNFVLVDVTPKTLVAALIGAALSLLRQVGMSNNVTQDRAPYRGPSSIQPPGLV